jgi:hypothetical protein
LFGLGAFREVGGAGAQFDVAWFVDSSEEFPPLPASALALTDETRWLPGGVADAYGDVCDWGGA